MGFFSKKNKADEQAAAVEKSTPATLTPANGTPTHGTPANGSKVSLPLDGEYNNDVVLPPGSEPRRKTPFIAYILGAVASVGGFIFGYESGQISGM